MDLDVALQTLSWAFEKAGPSKKLVLHFGSGEPLLHFELLKTLVREAQKRSAQQGIRLFFELTTNGTLVTQEIARFLAQNNFIVRVSCDGPAHLHNLNRPLKSGQGSYEDVIKGLNHLLDHMADRVTVNSVLTSGNRLIELWEWAKALNILHYHVIKVGAEPENSVNLPSRDLISFREDLEMITQEMFEELEMGRSPMDYQPITKLVRRLMIPLPITRFCGVSGTYLGVASDGKVYPCFRHLGMTEYELGNIFNGIDDEKRKEFLSNEGAEVDHRPVCQTCWGRYLCGGGCYADSTVYGPEKLEPQTHHCPFWKAEIETALRFYSKLLKTKPSHCFLLFKDNPATLFETEDSFLNFLEQESCS
jgi:uncharacterized protein